MQTIATHAARTAKYTGRRTNRCRGCGHNISKGSLQTIVRWFDTRRARAQLRDDRYHAECAPPFDASRVVLERPGFELDETTDRVTLRPCRPDMVVDLETRYSISDMNRSAHGSGFVAVARSTNMGGCNTHARGWHVTTRGCGHGSTRHQWYATLEDAKDHLVRWYLRRYRFADVRLPQ